MASSSPSRAQMEYMEDIKDKIDKQNCKDLIYIPKFSYKRGVKPDQNVLEQFYLKPVVVVAPHLLLGDELRGCSQLKCLDSNATVNNIVHHESSAMNCAK